MAESTCRKVYFLLGLHLPSARVLCRVRPLHDAPPSTEIGNEADATPLEDNQHQNMLIGWTVPGSMQNGALIHDSLPFDCLHALLKSTVCHGR